MLGSTSYTELKPDDLCCARGKTHIDVCDGILKKTRNIRLSTLQICVSAINKTLKVNFVRSIEDYQHMLSCHNNYPYVDVNFKERSTSLTEILFFFNHNRYMSGHC